MNGLIRAKEIINLQDIKKDNLNYKSKRGKTFFGKYSLPIVF